MQIKNKKILKVSILATILAVGILGGGYSLLNKDVTLVVAGKESTISTFKPNVKELLTEQNVKYDGNDIINLKLDSKLSDGLKVEIIDVTEKTIKESKEIPFEVNILEDEDLIKGKTKISTEGKDGKNELVYTVTYHNGEQIEKKFIEELVVSKSVDKVIKKGTKVELQVASSRGDNIRSKSTSNYSNNESTSNNTVNSDSSNQSSTNGKQMQVVATAYTGHSITSTGTTPKWGTIAVDPSVIPYGTKVYIPQFGQTFIAEDTGSAIRGNKIDIFMNDDNSVYNWGRKTIDIYIVG